MSKKAQEAVEPEVADVDLENEAFSQAFADAAGGKASQEEKKVVAQDQDADDVEVTPDPVVPVPAKDESKTTEPDAKANAPVEPPKPEDPPPPLTAMQQAEAEGAKLEAAEKEAQTGKSTADLLPEGYRNAPDIIATEAFEKFFASAPEHIQYLGTNGGPKGVCAVIDAFNVHIEKQAAKAAAAAESGTASGSAKARRIMDELGDVSITQSDGTKARVSEYLKEYGDLGEAVAAIADTLAEKRIKGFKPADQKPSVDVDRINKLEAELSEMRYWRAVTAEHSDAERIVKTDAFKQFAKEASPAMKRLMNSPDPMHGVKVIDAFKETQVAKAKSAVPAPAEKAKAMHSDTARGKTVAKRGEKVDDFDAGFDEALRQR